MLRAGLAAVRWKRGNPDCDRTTLRVAQRFAFGLDKPAVARAEGTDEAAIDALLAQDGFAAVIASWDDILDWSFARVHGPAGEAVPAGADQRARWSGTSAPPCSPSAS